MPNTQQLREQRANVWEQMKEVMDLAEREGRDLTAEERSKYDSAETHLDEIGDKITLQEKHEARTKEFGTVDRSKAVPPEERDKEPERRDVRPSETPEYRAAFTAYLRGGALDMPPEQRRILQRGWETVDDAEVRALGVGTTTAGGYTVPLEFRDTLIETMKLVSSVRSVADHISTDSGVSLPWPTMDDTGNVGAILAENTQVTQQDIVFGTNQLNAYMYTSKLVLVSLQLLNDAGFSIDQKLPVWLGRRIGRIQNQHFTTGTGSSQPNGLVTGGTVGKTGLTGQTLTIIYDDLVDMIDSLDAYYLASPNNQWMVSQALRKVVRKIKDTQGRPLWEPSLQVGQPDSLLGYGLVLNNDMPAPGANAKSLAFGDFEQGYIVRDVNDIQVLRLTERYADFLQVGFLAFERSDATVQNAAAYRLYQHSAT
jgi:HK97 family phage major capsid protein